MSEPCGILEFTAAVDPELVGWGLQVEALYDPLPPDDGSKKPDDRRAIFPRARAGAATVHRDRGTGMIMACIICGAVLTLDGKYCRQHMEAGGL